MYDDLKKKQRIENPELRGAKNLKEFATIGLKRRLKSLGLDDKESKKVLNEIPKSDMDDIEKHHKGLYKLLGKDTHVFKGDISPNNIVGGSGYHKRTPSQVASYIKKNPKRFGNEAVKGLTGAALVGYGVHRLLKR